jgi:hypothetical protein
LLAHDQTTLNAPAYRTWLEQQKCDSRTIAIELSQAGRVEKDHGNLDDHFADDRLEGVTRALNCLALRQNRR